MPEQPETMTNELVCTLVSEQTQLWLQASDYDHLNRMRETRITRESHHLTEQQAKATAIAQAGAYAMAVQAITARQVIEVTSQLKAYAALKSTVRV